MNYFTKAEMFQMHFIYGLTNSNAEEGIPKRVIACTKSFRKLHSRLTQPRRFARTTDDPGRPATVITPGSEEVILRMIERDSCKRKNY